MDLLRLIETCPLFDRVSQEILLLDRNEYQILALNEAARHNLRIGKNAPYPSYSLFYQHKSHLSLKKTLDECCAVYPSTITIYGNIIRVDGTIYPCKTEFSLVSDQGNWYFAVFTWDMSEYKSTLEKLTESENRYALAIEGSSDGIWDWSIPDNSVIYSERNRQLLGYSKSDFPDTYDAWASKVHPNDYNDVVSLVENHLATREPYEAVYRIKAANGSWHWWRSRGQGLWDEAGNPIRVLGTNSDITDLIRAQKQAETALEALSKQNAEILSAKSEIERTALHDPLTNLPNRRYLSQFVGNLVTNLDNQKIKLSFLQVDLDGFKQINDTLGHGAGDYVLKEVANRIKNPVREDDFVARVGGDEFVIVTINCETRHDTEVFADRLIESINLPIDFKAHSCRVGASIGISQTIGAQFDADRLLTEADLALYKAKAEGRNRKAQFDEAMRAEIRHRRTLSDEIIEALDQRQFIPYFQPQFSAKNLCLIGAESLARWNHPRRGVIPPSEFMPVADDLKVAHQIDAMILEKAWETRQHMCDQHGIKFKLSVNVSLRRLTDPNLLSAIEAFSIEPNALSFEILETVLLDKLDSDLEETLIALREKNIGIELDDFGTGHTSIISLLSLKPDRLKIDRGLIVDIVTDQKQRSLVSAITDMARSLGIQVTVEGVETAEQMQVLSMLGCDVFQGYHFAKPLPVEEFEAFLVRAREEESKNQSSRDMNDYIQYNPRKKSGIIM